MKNYQKNPKNLFMAFSCMCEKLMLADRVKSIKCHSNMNIWSLNLNPWFKSTSFKSQLFALAQITACCHVMIMHHIVALH